VAPVQNVGMLLKQFNTERRRCDLAAVRAVGNVYCNATGLPAVWSGGRGPCTLHNRLRQSDLTACATCGCALWTCGSVR